MPPKKIRCIADEKQPKITFFTGTHGDRDGKSAEITENEIEVNQTPQNTNETETGDGPEKRKFQNRWLETYPWLEFDQKSNKMSCKLCKGIGANNTMALGTDNCKTSTLTRHVSGTDHQRALTAPKERANLKSAVNQVLGKEEKAVILALKSVYWMTKEGLPLTKYASLMNFLKWVETPDIDALAINERVDYSSYNTATELLTALSNTIDADVTEKLKQSPVVSILTDESTDIVVHHKLCISARVVDPSTLKPSTHFLTDVRLDKATGKGIFEEIQSHLKSRKVPMDKVMGLGTDGASTMTGTREGLTGHFLRVNPHLVNTHCAAHRLALCSEQAAKGVPAMAEFQRNLEMIFYHFKKSPNKVDKMEAVQKVLDEPQLKYREVHQIRWLSFYEALDAVYRTLDSLITYLSTVSGDAAVVGLKKRVGDELFISLAYAMMDILPPIMRLSLVFQKQDLDIGIVQVSVDECIKSLQEIRDDINPLQRPTFLSQLTKDLSNGVFKDHHRINKLKSPTQFQKVKTEFIDALLQNISNRFPNTQLLTSLSVLAMRPISFLSDTELQEWGNNSIQRLAEFYGEMQVHEYKNPQTKSIETFKSEALVDATELKVEWQRLKNVVKAQQYPRSSMASLWNLITEHHRDEFPNLTLLASLALTHPVHTADCERAFSSQNQVTTASRNRLSSDQCDKLMRLMIEGPDIKKFNFTRALTEWRSVKERVIFTAH